MFSGMEVEPPTRRLAEEVVAVVVVFETRGPVVDEEAPFCIPVLTLAAGGAEGGGLMCVF